MVEGRQAEIPGSLGILLYDQYAGYIHEGRCHILYLLKSSGSIFSRSSVHLSFSSPEDVPDPTRSAFSMTASRTMICTSIRMAMAIASLGRESMATGFRPPRCGG